MGTHHFDLQYFDCNADLKQRINVLTRRNADLLALAVELREALDHVQRNFHLLLKGAPVRDVEETDAEVEHALARAAALLDKETRP